MNKATNHYYAERFIMIDTVILDMGNVLIDFRWRALFNEMGLTGEKFERMASATVLDPVWNEFDRGVWTDEMLLEAFIKNAPELEAELKDFFHNRFRGLLKKFDYTDEWIESLRSKGYRVYILSNFSKKAHVECSDELDYISKTDGAVISYQVHMIKPDPEIYKYLLETYSVDPDRAVFIDDTKVNVEAAEALGIHGIVFRGREDADRAIASLAAL